MYVGAIPTTGDFLKLDSISTSATTTFNLRQGGVAVYPQSANHCLVVLNGVLQTAGSSFNIVNDTIVFASSLASSDVINQILVLGNVNDIGVVSDDTVSTAKLQANAVTAAKFNADVISGQTELAAEPADTDEFLVSDAGVIKRIDYSHIKGGGASTLISTTDISDGTSTVQISFTGSYALYYVTFTNVNPNNDDNTFRHAFSDDDFSSVNQQLYGAYYRQEARRDSSTSSSTGHQAATGYVRIADHVGAGQYEGVSGIIYYASMKTSAPKARYWGNMASYHQDERMSNHMLTGFADVTNVITGVAYNYDSGTFKSGQIKLYGFN